MRTKPGPPSDGPARGRSDAQVTGADPAMVEAIRAAVAVSGLDPRVVTSDPAYVPVRAALARQLRLRARTQPGEPPLPLPERAADLERAVEQGDRARGPGNLALLAAHERLERLGRPLNAVVTAVGAPRRNGRGPLAGRPVAVKDIIAVAGVPARCGSPASDPAPARRDAAVVATLRAAGAEVFATSQCLEYAAGFAHPAIGDTRNPRDPGRTSGGSSGGSAALVAAGVCDLALGTDTGGSVRIPAAYCGVTGLKPTYGLLPADGIFPLSPSCDHAGTLTSAVRGAAELLRVLAPAARQRDALAAGRQRAAGTGAPYTVGVLAAQLADPSVTPPVRAAVTGALAALAAAGWQLRELDPPWLAGQAGLARWDEVLAVIVASEAARVHAGRDTAGYAEGTRALLAFGASVSADRYARALAERDELTAAIGACLAGVDALAGPTVGYQAPAQDPPFGVGEDSGESRFTGPYNLSGHPAVSLPVPAAGLPAGLQLAGHRDGDLALLRLAAAAEEVLAPAAGAVPRQAADRSAATPVPAPAARGSAPAPAKPRARRQRRA